MLIAGHLLVGTARAEQSLPTAAELDWVSASQLSPEQAIELPWFCSGGYVEPTSSTLPDSTQISASAEAAVHLFGQSSTLQGDVVITRGNTRINSPFVAIDDESKVARIEGPLIIRRPGFVMTGERATSNLIDSTGAVEQATFLLHQAKLRGSAASITQGVDEVIHITEGEMTRCDPGTNTWAIKGQDFALDAAAGYGTARDVTLTVKDVPVLYLPWFRFPINEARQSGFLLASIGSDSTGGTDISVPYYLNLAPNFDATYQLRSLSKRGLIHDGQLRHLSQSTVNEVNLGYLAADDSFDSRRFIDLSNGNTNTDFEAQKRWYLDLRHQGGWDSRWQTNINYSAVSDFDYLQDIGGNIGTATNSEIITPIEQGLANRRSAALDRIGQVTYHGDQWRASAVVREFQNLDATDSEQYAVLPSLDLSHAFNFKGVVLNSKLAFARYDKDTLPESQTPDLAAITGDRAIVATTLSYPVLRRWGFFTPAVELMHRQYHLDYQVNAIGANADSGQDLTTAVFNIDTGLYFDRAMQLGGSSLRQTLEPRAFYLYSDEKFQDNLPLFDVSTITPGFGQLFRNNRFTGADRIADANQLSLGLTTRLLEPKTGRQLLSASIGQIQYFADRRVNLVATRPVDITTRRSPLFTEASLSPSDDIRFRAALEWEPRNNTLNRAHVSLKYSSQARRIINVGYSYTNPDIERRPGVAQTESNVSAIWPVTGHWSGIGLWNFDLDKHQTLETLVGVEFNDCCWKSRLVLRRFTRPLQTGPLLVNDPSNATGLATVDTLTRKPDTGVFFEVQFKGLATLGRQLDALLDETIPGYRRREDRIGL
ncbi:MAG: LPS-assembly protein [Cyclobacteriaceae bacterium]|jgi:LPS-assembly protein